GDDHVGLVRLALKAVERGDDRREIVPIDAHHVPPEGGEAVPDRLGGHDLLGRTIDAESVAVDDAHERPQTEVVGGHYRLPHLTFGELAVAHHDVAAKVPSLHARAERHAY